MTPRPHAPPPATATQAPPAPPLPLPPATTTVTATTDARIVASLARSNTHRMAQLASRFHTPFETALPPRLPPRRIPPAVPPRKNSIGDTSLSLAGFTSLEAEGATTAPCPASPEETNLQPSQINFNSSSSSEHEKSYAGVYYDEMANAFEDTVQLDNSNR